MVSPKVLSENPLLFPQTPLQKSFLNLPLVPLHLNKLSMMVGRRLGRGGRRLPLHGFPQPGMSIAHTVQIHLLRLLQPELSTAPFTGIKTSLGFLPLPMTCLQWILRSGMGLRILSWMQSWILLIGLPLMVICFIFQRFSFTGVLNVGSSNALLRPFFSLNLSLMRGLRGVLELGQYLTILFILSDFISLINSINTLLNVGSRAFSP